MNANGEIIIFNVLAQILLLLTLITAAVTDLRDRKVYNWLTFPAMIFGLTLAWADGGIGLFFDHLLRGFLPAVLIFGLFWWMGGLQGGDMKLMAAIGAIKGYPFIITSMFWTGIAGAILALGKLALPILFDCMHTRRCVCARMRVTLMCVQKHGSTAASTAGGTAASATFPLVSFACHCIAAGSKGTHL